MRSKAEIEAADLGYPQIAALSLHRCQGDLCGELSSLSRLAMVLSAPRTARLQRLRQWSYDKFGACMLEGGDLYAQEEAFFRFAAERSPLDAVSWLDELFSVRSCTSDGRRDCGCLVAQVLAHLAEVFPLSCGESKSLPTEQSGGFFAHISAQEGRSAAEKTSALYRFCAVPVCDFRRDRCRR